MQKYNVQSLENKDIQQAFRSKIMELNENTSAIEDSQKGIEKQWSICEKIMKEAAESVIGMQGPPQRNDWFDDDCAEVTFLKNKAYKNMLAKKNSRQAREEYQRRRYEEKKIHRRKKTEAWKGLMEEIEEEGRRKETRKFYRKVNIIRKGYKPRTGMCKDKMGNLVTGKKKVLQRWAEHFDELLNGHGDEEGNKGNGDGDGEGDTEDMGEYLGKEEEENGTDRNLETTNVPTKEEVKAAVNKLKNNKAPGPDGIPSEILKGGYKSMENRVHELIVQIWNEERIPVSWTEALICPIHKKGDVQNCENSRGITLVNIAYKVLTIMLYGRLKPHTNKIIRQYQCGFREGVSKIDQIQTLRQILEKTLEFQIDTHHLFIDFKTVYDKVNRNQLYKAMQELGIPLKLVR